MSTPVRVASARAPSAAAGIDRRIAPAILAIIVAIILIGFAKNFYLRAWLGTRTLILTAWVHGFVMSAWLALFLVQIVLVARGRVDAHRRVGRCGLVLAGAVVCVGVLTIAVRARLMYPAAGAGRYAAVFVAFDGVSLLLFGVLVALALNYRRTPRIHRRLMTMAMVALLPPALGRLVAYFRHDHVEVLVVGLMVATVLVCVAADTLRTRHSQPATMLPGTLIIAVNAATCIAQLSI